MKKPLNMKKIVIFFSILLVFVLMSSITAYAIYVRSTGFNGVVSSNKFYFESDLLDESNPTYELNSETTEVTFNVRNYLDSYRISEVDIVVTVTASGGTLNKTDITLTKNSECTEVITLSNLIPGNTYEVSVKGSAGYEKELKAKFFVRSTDAGIYKYVDESNPAYILLTVWSTDKSGDVVISFNGADIVPDKTWSTLIDFDLSLTTINLHVEEYTSHVYRFFIKSTSDLSKLSVKQNGTELDEKIPS